MTSVTSSEYMNERTYEPNDPIPIQPIHYRSQLDADSVDQQLMNETSEQNRTEENEQWRR